MGTLEDPSLEVMWLKSKPRKLPQRFSCIIVVCIYHSPGADSAIMREHLINGIDNVVRRHPDCGVILMSDFNRLKDNFINTHYRHVQMAKDPTRGQAVLDEIWTNMPTLSL